MKSREAERAPYLALLEEAYPGWRHFGRDCIVRDAFAGSYNWQPVLIKDLRNAGVWDDIVYRLREVHPTGPDHHPQHDNGLFGALTEAQAAVWAHRVGLPPLKFVRREGAPDWEFDGGWLEAKRITTSDNDRAADQLARDGARKPEVYARLAPATSPDPGLRRQLRSVCDDAVKKWARQGNTGVLYVYVDVFLDLGPLPTEALTELRLEAESIVTSPGIRVTIAEAAGAVIVIPPDAPTEFGTELSS
jgi:hypothetical protein